MYEQIRGAARGQLAGERPGHTLSATALVHEVYPKLAGPRDVPWAGRGHFYGTAAEPDAGAQLLNRVAWGLLTDEYPELHEPTKALGYAQRAGKAEETAHGGNLWMYLDTLTLAQHMTGDTAAAVETQRRAIALMPDGADPAMHERRAEYEAALAGRNTDVDGDEGQ